MSSRPSTRPGLRRPDFGPMQHRSFRTASRLSSQNQEQQQQLQQRDIRRRTIVDGSTALAWQQINFESGGNSAGLRADNHLRQAEEHSLHDSLSSGYYSVSTSAAGGSYDQQQQTSLSRALNDSGQYSFQNDTTWGTMTAATSTIPDFMTGGQAPPIDDSLEDPFITTAGSAPTTPRHSLPKTPRRRSQTRGDSSVVQPRRSSLRAMAESSELMRRRSIVESQRQVKISRDKHSPMNIIRMLTRVPGFIPAPRPTSGGRRGPIPGSENWRKLTPRSERTRFLPIGDGNDELKLNGQLREGGNDDASSIRRRSLANPFLDSNHRDVGVTAAGDEEGSGTGAYRPRDLTDVSMEYKLGAGKEADVNEQEDVEHVDSQGIPTTPGQHPTEEGREVEDPFDDHLPEARRERSLLATEGDQTGEMSIGCLSQILGEKAVVQDEMDSQMQLDQNVPKGGDSGLPQNQHGLEGKATVDMPEDGAAALLEGEDNWEDIPDNAGMLGDDSATTEPAQDEAPLERSGEADTEEAQLYEQPQDEQMDQQDQQDEGEQDQDGGVQGVGHDNQALFLDDLPSELGMLSDGQFLPVDKPKGKKAVRMSKHGLPIPSLPVSLQRQLVQTFVRSRFSREAMEEITEASHMFFEQVSGDLAAYAKHAGRRTIDDSDVECLMRRLRLTNSKVSMESLLHRYLPRELRDLVLYPKELRPPGQR